MTRLTDEDLARRARLQEVIDQQDAERGRPLTAREKLDNLQRALAEHDADCAADDAMHEIWSQWLQFYERHFRAPGLKVSMADQTAFYEIAQPIMRRLAHRGGPDLLMIAKIFLGHDPRFQISVGGNPVAVDKMLDDARATVTKAEGGWNDAEQK